MPCCFTSLLSWISFLCSSPAWACPHPQRRNPSAYLPVEKALCTKLFYVCNNFHRSAQSGAAFFYAGCTSAGESFVGLEKRPSTFYPAQNPGAQPTTAASRKISSLRTIRSPAFYAVCQASEVQRTEYPLLSMPTKTPFARFFFAFVKTFIGLHNRELRVLCGMPYR